MSGNPPTPLEGHFTGIPARLNIVRLTAVNWVDIHLAVVDSLVDVILDQPSYGVVRRPLI